MEPTRVYLSVGLILGLAGCGGEKQTPEPPRLVETMVVAPATGGTSSTYPGQTVSRYDAQLGFRVAGTIVAKLVDVGSVVRAGQALARLDPSDARLNLNSAEAQTSAASSAAGQQAVDLARARRLLGEGFISQAEYDRQRVAVDQARAQLRSARSLQAGASNQLDYTVLRAERGGTVAAFDGAVGQVVAAGQPVVTIAQPGALEAAISIPEGEVEAFRRATLRVHLWSRPGPGYPGVIRTLSPAANQQTRTFDVRVAFDPGSDAAAIGQTAEVAASNAVGRPALRVPISALTQRGGRPAVWVVSGNPSVVSPRAVTVTQVQQNAALLSGGVGPGERIVTAGVQLLHPGDRVRIEDARRLEQ